MLHFEEALEIVQRNTNTIGCVRLPMIQALNHVLAEDLMSDIDIPPFNKAAMDGYACRKQDIRVPMEIIEEIPAGSVPLKRIMQGQCSRIMTGAPVPEGADFILMKEHAVVVEGDKIISSKELSANNICIKGEDVKQGNVVLNGGELIQPQHIAILASIGCTEPLVYKRPLIALISTGNELVEPSRKPGISQIRNSNSYQIMAQALQMGLSYKYLGIVADSELSLTDHLSEAVKKYDVIIISGGVSVGDYDFVPKVLQNLGVEILFHGLKAKPGKHLLFGKKENHYVIGLPGNPVSSFVQFYVLVKPLLQMLMGQIPRPGILYMPIAEDYNRKKDDILAFIPVEITEYGNARPLEYHGSAHIQAYTKANGIMEMPIGISEYIKGDIVRVRPI